MTNKDVRFTSDKIVLASIIRSYYIGHLPMTQRQ